MIGVSVKWFIFGASISQVPIVQINSLCVRDMKVMVVMSIADVPNGQGTLGKLHMQPAITRASLML